MTCKTLSRDGTPIAYERAGQGPALILVDGALCYRGQGPSGQLVTVLSDHFTVYSYDRRGRGESGDTPPYAIEREVEDLDALVKVAGGTAYVFGISSGAALALEAAHAGVPIRKLALYEAPFIVDDARTPIPPGFKAGLHAALDAGRRGDAVRAFLRLVGMPSILVPLMRFFPGWSKLIGVAHTLPYDIAIVQEHERGLPLSRQQWSGATLLTHVIDGGKSPQWMRNAMQQLSQVLPNATYRTLEGQTHMVKAKVLEQPLVEFFTP